MKRREFLKNGLAKTEQMVLENEQASGQETAAASASGDQQNRPRLLRTTTGLEPYAGPWNAKAAAHLLRRTMFGPKRSEILSAAAGSLDNTLTSLLAQQPAPPDPLNASGTTWVNSPFDPTNDGTYAAYLKAWWMGRIVTQGITVQERMVLFWHNHFPTEYNDVQDSRYIYKQNALFRLYALGNIKQLVKLITLDPAMLRYLNGYANRGDGRSIPDENYGRELQELFTIGKGTQTTDPTDPNNISYTNYTEKDVKAAARVLTGWTDWPLGMTTSSYRNVNTSSIGSSFIPSRHDATNKTFSYAYGNTVVQGRPGFDGALELDDMLNMIFAQKEAAKYLCRKLYRWFVYYDIDANAEQNVIVPLADYMIANNYEVVPVLDKLFRSAHFFDDNNIGCMIKNPIDLVAGAVRLLGIPLPLPDVGGYYTPYNSLRGTAANLQMNLMDPPDVSGWKAYYQVPDFYELWISTATLPQRGQFTDNLFRGLPGNSAYVLNRVAYAASMSAPSAPFKLIDDFAADLFPIPLTQNQKDYLIYNAMGLRHGGEYDWTNAWDAYNAPGGNTSTNLSNLLKMLDPLLKFMLRMAEYQLT
ncbi:MAG: DUF1800 domain-containing protein [Ignavibacteriales bacterium]|nr:DUF1800 domain-containing protein [Ignavibacteriales bacterium]